MTSTWILNYLVKGDNLKEKSPGNNVDKIPEYISRGEYKYLLKNIKI